MNCDLSEYMYDGLPNHGGLEALDGRGRTKLGSDAIWVKYRAVSLRLEL